MGESPLGTEGSCECIEQAVAYSQQGVVLQVGGCAWGKQHLTVKNFFIVTKCFKAPRIWIDTLA
jgi:hypothetical protein